jgi:hypothetical protein
MFLLQNKVLQKKATKLCMLCVTNSIKSKTLRKCNCKSVFLMQKEKKAMQMSLLAIKVIRDTRRYIVIEN